MPEVTGHDFPEHVHVEYPKVLYKDGVSHVDGNPGESITVRSAEEEAAANEDGYSAPSVEEVAQDEADEATEAEATEAVAVVEPPASPAPSRQRRK